MLNTGDKFYFIKRRWYNIDLPFNTELTIGRVYDTRNNIVIGGITTIIRIEEAIVDDYYPEQFILSEDYLKLCRKEKLKNLKNL